MVTDFGSLSTTDLLGDAVANVFKSFQQDFPVVDGQHAAMPKLLFIRCQAMCRSARHFSSPSAAKGLAMLDTGPQEARLRYEVLIRR